jgi:L-alanine-DL-glutamate epimerase-like enolase superfamily enzyme
MAIIDGIIVHLVQWPLKMKRRHGVGDIERVLPGVILELRTSDGLVGWGEAAPWSVFSGDGRSRGRGSRSLPAPGHPWARPFRRGRHPGGR